MWERPYYRESELRENAIDLKIIDWLERKRFNIDLQRTGSSSSARFFSLQLCFIFTRLLCTFFFTVLHLCLVFGVSCIVYIVGVYVLVGCCNHTIDPVIQYRSIPTMIYAHRFDWILTASKSSHRVFSITISIALRTLQIVYKVSCTHLFFFLVSEIQFVFKVVALHAAKLCVDHYWCGIPCWTNYLNCDAFKRNDKGSLPYWHARNIKYTHNLSPIFVYNLEKNV